MGRLAPKVVLPLFVALATSRPAIVASQTANTADPPKAVPRTPLAAPQGPYLLRVGDVVEVSFLKTPDLNRVQRVGPDGAIYLPFVGKVMADRRSVDDLTSELQQRYTEHLREARITVSIQEFSGLRVYVAGEVNRPGEVAYRGDLTAVQALFAAGGYNKRARLDSLLLVRRMADGSTVGRLFDARDVLQRGHFERDEILAPADLIFVPKSRIASVNDAMEQFLKNNIPIPLGLTFFIN